MIVVTVHIYIRVSILHSPCDLCAAQIFPTNWLPKAVVAVATLATVTDSLYDSARLEYMLKDRSSRKYNRWAWRKDNGGWTDYTQEQTCCLEKAFVEERLKEVVIDDIRIDMNCRNQLWQRVISDPSKQQPVRRHLARVHAKMWVPAVGEAAEVFSASNNKGS